MKRAVTLLTPLALGMLALFSLSLGGCANLPPPPPPEEKPAPPPPPPPAPKPKPKIKEDVILLPTQEGKSSGAVEVSVGAQKQRLDKAYEATVVVTGEKISTRFSSAEEVQAIAGQALNTLPVKPVSFTLLFDIDSDKLPPDVDVTVDKIVAEIRKRQVPDVSVIGHTDRSGNTKTNFALSQRRAENVYRLIVAKGGKPENVKVEVVGKGDSENAVINMKTKFEQRNRRVEVFVR